MQGGLTCSWISTVFVLCSLPGHLKLTGHPQGAAADDTQFISRLIWRISEKSLLMIIGSTDIPAHWERMRVCLGKAANSKQLPLAGAPMKQCCIVRLLRHWLWNYDYVCFSQCNLDTLADSIVLLQFNLARIWEIFKAMSRDSQSEQTHNPDQILLL